MTDKEKRWQWIALNLAMIAITLVLMRVCTELHNIFLVIQAHR